ncbi:hypothetical protein D3C71_1446720 [compost metagenome]
MQRIGMDDRIAVKLPALRKRLDADNDQRRNDDEGDEHENDADQRAAKQRGITDARRLAAGGNCAHGLTPSPYNATPAPVASW